MLCAQGQSRDRQMQSGAWRTLYAPRSSIVPDFSHACGALPLADNCIDRHDSMLELDLRFNRDLAMNTDLVNT